MAEDLSFLLHTAEDLRSQEALYFFHAAVDAA